MFITEIVLSGKILQRLSQIFRQFLNKNLSRSIIYRIMLFIIDYYLLLVARYDNSDRR